MRSGELTIDRLESDSTPGWIERFSLVEKMPFALMFGAIFGLCAPGFDCSWLAWVGLAPLLVLIRSSGTAMEATVLGLTYGFGYYLVSLNWYLGLFPLRWMGLDDWVGVQAVGVVWILESIHEALLFAALAWVIHCLPMRAGFLPHLSRPFFPFLICVPVVWVFFHWVIATSEIFLGMPVNQLAYTQHNMLPLIQLARLGGSGMVDFILILSNCVVANLILEALPLATKLGQRTDSLSPKLGALIDTAVVAVVVAGLMTWGSINIRHIALASRCENEAHLLKQTPSIPVALLQGNVTIEEEKLSTVDPAEIAKRYANLGTATGALILVLPEGAADSKQFGPGLLISRLKGIVQSEKKSAIVGTVEKVNEGMVSAARLFAVPPPKEAIYVKQRLAPFGEVAPLGAFGRISEQLTGGVAGSSSAQVVNPHGANLLGTVFGKAGVSISTEVIFPNLVADEVRRGAQLLVNLANLNRFHSSNLNKQLLAAATLRAVENGRFMVVSTTTGTSAIIDPAGVVTTKSYAGKRGVILDTVQFLYDKTPYNKMGRVWWL